MSHVRLPRIALLALALSLGAVSTAHATFGGSPGTPNFDAVTWHSLACDAPDLIHETSPSDVNFVGTTTHSPAYIGYDAGYLYFRLRMDTDPDSWCGWSNYSWTALLQVPSGNRRQYQYQLSVNGKTDTLELWQNTVASDIVYTPLFQDNSEVKVFTVPFSKTGGTLGNTRALARTTRASTSFNGNRDYFVDFGIPASLLISKGVIMNASQLSLISVFPATATAPNKHDKGYLNCPFQPEIECAQAADCNDGDACTTDTCVAGTCGNLAIQGCVPCAQPADCNDGNACTTETCSVGVCGHQAVQGCVPCSQATACTDGDACTTDLCSGGVCGHAPAASCAGCDGDAECADDNPCTTHACGADGSCQVTVIDGCRTCDTPGDCDDGDACTSETCAEAVCQTAPIAGCAREVCDAGLDHDGDAAVDCADTDCDDSDVCSPPVNPPPGGEGGETGQCGNCSDDDGDGLVDYEDPDCCAQTYALILRRMRLEMPVKGASRIKIRTRVGARERLELDPYHHGASLQISDPKGQVFCKKIPMQPPLRKPRKDVFKFRDKTGKLAGGLRGATFRVRKDGSVLFRTRGKTMEMREPESTDLRVTLRIGDQCMHAFAPLRANKIRHTMKFP